jgi:hypothetical protein
MKLWPIIGQPGTEPGVIRDTGVVKRQMRHLARFAVLARTSSAGLQTGCTGGVHAARGLRAGQWAHTTADLEVGTTDLWISS